MIRTIGINTNILPTIYVSTTHSDSQLMNVQYSQDAHLLNNLIYVQMEVVNKTNKVVMLTVKNTWNRRAKMMDAKYVKTVFVDPNVLNIMDVLLTNLFIVEVECVSNNTSTVQAMTCVH